jgi:hypothetical protein
MKVQFKRMVLERGRRGIQGEAVSGGISWGYVAMRNDVRKGSEKTNSPSW